MSHGAHRDTAAALFFYAHQFASVNANLLGLALWFFRLLEKRALGGSFSAPVRLILFVIPWQFDAIQRL